LDAPALRTAVLFFACFLFGCGSDTKIVADAAPEAMEMDDAGPDIDNGAPSTDYPAPHPPLPVLTNAMNGPVLGAPKIYLVFYPNHPFEAAVQAFTQAMTTSPYWTATTSEYGVGAFSYGGTIDLQAAPPATITQADLQTWVGAQIQSGAFGPPDPQAIYTIMFPMGTTITQPNPINPLLPTSDSCKVFLGYHDNVEVKAGRTGLTSFAYAVIPTCGVLDSVTETLSHEWVEATTDPQVTSSGTFTLAGGPHTAFYGPDQDHIVWSLLGGGEAGDLCVPEGSSISFTPPELKQRVQRTWSNLSAMASHDPCVPRAAGAFFDSAPVLEDTVSFESTLTGKVTTKGIVIAQGESKTIEVDLFSDADTGGPWKVMAEDLLSTVYASYGLKPTMTFDWDRAKGENGEKLHLTITVTGPSLIGGAHAFMITSWLGNRTAVWPGLVVEE
jgi:hypothetical protein